MKIQILLSFVAGACAGAVVTFISMRSIEPIAGVAVPAPAERQEQVREEESQDPFEDPSGDLLAADLDSGEAFVDRHGYKKMDMSDVFQRDLCISFWYANMTTVVDDLELHTGHKFEKQVGKAYASPSEILKEQAAFLESFERETRRIEEAGRPNPADENKPE